MSEVIEDGQTGEVHNAALRTAAYTTMSAAVAPSAAVAVNYSVQRSNNSATLYKVTIPTFQHRYYKPKTLLSTIGKIYQYKTTVAALQNHHITKKTAGT